MRPTRALIHRQNLLSNLDRLRGLVPAGTAVCAGVKANAYGHGAALVVPWLAEAGVGMFGVATVEEGVELRRLGIIQPVLLYGSLQPDELTEAVEADLDLFLWSREAIARAGQAAAGRGKPLRVHLKVDTGMGRVGCRPDEAEELAGRIINNLALEFTGLCTHLASSDGPGPLQPPAQLERFAEVRSALSARGWMPRYVHAANSGGVVSWPESRFNLIRPGLSLYGYPEPFLPVLELVTRVGYVKTAPKGTPLSYGSRYVTPQDGDVATLPVGYGDGYRRALTNRAPVLINDRVYRVSGTVCMDQILVDLGPGSGVKEGDPVVLFGPQDPLRRAQAPDAEDLAGLADTISYEILTGLSARVPRVTAATPRP